MAETCTATRIDGSKCPAYATLASISEGVPLCIWHQTERDNPELARDKKVRGGELSRRPPEWITQAKNEGLTFEDMAAIGFEILENERAMGQSPGVAAVMNSTLRLLIELTELSTLGTRLSTVEELLQNFNRGTDG